MAEPNYDMTDCPECGGQGGFDDGPKCTGLCDWCGGCYDQIACDNCQGTGEVIKSCEDCGDDMVEGECRWCLENPDDAQVEAAS